MDQAIATIQKLAATATEDVRRRLMTSLNRLSLSLETPNDTIHRYGHMVSRTDTP